MLQKQPDRAQNPGQRWQCQWCQRWARGTESSWANAAEHSWAQCSGKTNGKHDARDLASEPQPSSLLLSSHRGRGRLSCKGSPQLKASVQQHYFRETLFLLPQVNTVLCEKPSLSHIPFAFNTAVVIICFSKSLPILLHYQKGWEKRELLTWSFVLFAW